MRDSYNRLGVTAAHLEPWRREDLGAMAAIEEVIHADMRERPEVQQEKVALFPRGCFCLHIGDGIAGYAVSHPWRLHESPPLAAFLQALPDPATCLYLHDVAILPTARGFRSAAALLEKLEALARQQGLPAIALTSVYGTEDFWASFGFERSESHGADGSYGAGAVYMTRRV